MSAGILFNDTVAVTATAAGNSGEAMISNGAGSAPSFQAIILPTNYTQLFLLGGM